jgi:hypothetical protein
MGDFVYFVYRATDENGANKALVNTCENESQKNELVKSIKNKKEYPIVEQRSVHYG